MWTPFEQWQVAQIERLSHTDREAAEAALNALWDACPDLLEQLTIAAVEQGELSVSQAASALGITHRGVEYKVSMYRRRTLKEQCVVVTNGENAQLADSGLPIWEIVRVYRKLGTREKLQEALP